MMKSQKRYRTRCTLGQKPLPARTRDTLERTLGWISRQVAPTLKMLKKIDAGNSTSYLKEIEDNAKLTEKHLQIIRQQTADTEELITE